MSKMANIFLRISKTQKVILLCRWPIRFIDLKRKARISDAGLTKVLKSLQRRGWLRKREDGMYELTQRGRRIVPEAKRAECARVNFKTARKLVQNVTIDYVGVESEDGLSLLRDIAQAIKRYVAQHPRETIILLIRYY